MVITRKSSGSTQQARTSKTQSDAVIRLRRSNTTIPKDGFQSGTSGKTCAPEDKRLRAIASAGAGAAAGVRAGLTESEPSRPAEAAFLKSGAKNKTKAAERMLRRAGFRPGKV